MYLTITTIFLISGTFSHVYVHFYLSMRLSHKCHFIYYNFDKEVLYVTYCYFISRICDFAVRVYLAISTLFSLFLCFSDMWLGLQWDIYISPLLLFLMWLFYIDTVSPNCFFIAHNCYFSWMFDLISYSTLFYFS